jgi:hypothetical protein
MTHRSIVLALIGFLGSAIPVWAEVMDKEPTVTANWTWAVFSAVLAVIAWRWRWWVGAIVSTLALTGIFFMYQEITDPFVGPAIRAFTPLRRTTG